MTNQEQAQPSDQPAWHARLYQPGDEHGIVALYNRVFGYSRTADWWHWKIKSFPSPLELTWVAVAGDDESIVGHYAGIPARMKLEGITRPVIVNVDAMTSPNFRRRGILLRLGESANRHWFNAGYAAVVGLPNEQWGSRIEALGWQTLFPLRWLRFPLRLGKILARPGRLPRPFQPPAYLLGEAAAHLWAWPRIRRLARHTALAIREARAPGPDLDWLWSDLEGHYPNCLVRDASYVGWRFLSAQPTPYRVLLAYRDEQPSGYIAYRYFSPRGNHAAYIADLFTAPDDRNTARALLFAALSDLWQSGASHALVTAVPGSALHSTLVDAGAAPLSAAFDYDLVLLDPSLHRRTLADPLMWHASGSDSDVV